MIVGMEQRGGKLYNLIAYDLPNGKRKVRSEEVPPTNIKDEFSLLSSGGGHRFRVSMDNGVSMLETKRCTDDLCFCHRSIDEPDHSGFCLISYRG